MLIRLLQITSVCLFLGAACSSAPAGPFPKGDPRRKVLVVVSAAHTLTLKDGQRHETGYFLSELYYPAMAMLEAGYSIEIATPAGKAPRIDPAGQKSVYYGLSSSEMERAEEFAGSRADLKNPLVLEKITPAAVTGYCGIFIPGGMAPMEDLANNKALGRLLVQFHIAGKPTGLICHGPVALLSARYGVDQWPYRGYKMTSVKRIADRFSEIFGSIDGNLSFYVNEALEKEGGDLSHTVLPAGSYVVVHKELITGQDPFSAGAFSSRGTLTIGVPGQHIMETVEPVLEAAVMELFLGVGAEGLLDQNRFFVVFV